MKNNFVAKYANRFNRADRHRDRKNDYKRKPKHPKKALQQCSG